MLQIEQFGATREVTIKRSERRLYPVNHKTYPGDTWAVVCSIEAPIGQKILHLRSIVQVEWPLLEQVVFAPITLKETLSNLLTIYNLIRSIEVWNYQDFCVF